MKWGQKAKSCVEFGSIVFIFWHLICLFSEINAAHKVLLLLLHTEVSSHCSKPAVFYLLQNLLSLLMRLIKLVQSLFNEALAALSTERTTAGKTDRSHPKGEKLWNGFLKRGFKKLNQSKAVIIHSTSEQQGPWRDERISPVTSMSNLAQLTPSSVVGDLLWQMLRCEQMQKEHTLKLTYLSFKVSCFIWCGPGQDPGVTEAGSQECSQYKDKQHATYDWNNRGQLACQVRTTGKTRQREKNISKETTKAACQGLSANVWHDENWKIDK